MTDDSSAGDRATLDCAPGGVAHVRLNRPDKLNALDPAMFDALAAIGDALSRMPGLRCVVLSGEGRAFCAGLDLATFESLAADDTLDLAARTHGVANRFQHAALLWSELAVPVVAAIHGVCYGGGLQIAAGADVRVAAPDTRLAVMEMKWGLVPDMGGFALWRGRVREDVLRDLTYTNREFSGEEALRLGFATLVDPDPLARATALAGQIATRNPDAIRAAKALFRGAAGMSVPDILMAESLAQQRLIGSPNQIEALRSEIEGRAPRFSDP